MKAVLGLAGSKAQGGAEIVEKPLFLVCSGAMGAYMPKSRDCSGATLQAIIRGRAEPESVLHSDGRRGCDGLETTCQSLRSIS